MTSVAPTQRTGRPASDLRPYQRAEVETLAAGISRGLFWQPGSGKTATVLHAVARLRAQGSVARVLLVSTPLVIRTVWGPETKEWQETASLTYRAATGTKAQRMATLCDPTLDIVAIGFDSAADALDAGQFDLLIVDEASLCRTVTSERFKAIIQLAFRAKQRIILTGSPAPNSTLDLFGVVSLIDLGQRLGTNWRAFLETYSVKYGRKKWQYREQEGAKAQILAKIKDVVSALRTEDILTLPTKLRRIAEVEMPPDAWAVYRSAENEAINALTGEAIHIDATLIKLQQIANGFLMDSSGLPERIHSAKVDAAVTKITEIVQGGGSVLVIYSFREDLARLREHFPRADVLGSDAATGDAADIVQRWTAGQIDILLLNPRAGGHGLNLQKNPRCADMVWMSGTWSAESYEQTVARLHRPGLGHPVEVTIFVAADTVDELIVTTMDRKLGRQDAIMAALKERAIVTSPTTAPDRIQQLRDARKAAARVHPDAGGSNEAFAVAWAKYQRLLAQI